MRIQPIDATETGAGCRGIQVDFAKGTWVQVADEDRMDIAAAGEPVVVGVFSAEGDALRDAELIPWHRCLKMVKELEAHHG